VITRLVLQIDTGPRACFQIQQDHRTGGYTVTRNGQPVIATTTHEEATDELADLQYEKRLHMTEEQSERLPVHITAEQAIALLYD
jgi:hypothetical protein